MYMLLMLKHNFCFHVIRRFGPKFQIGLQTESSYHPSPVRDLQLIRGISFGNYYPNASPDVSESLGEFHPTFNIFLVRYLPNADKEKARSKITKRHL